LGFPVPFQLFRQTHIKIKVNLVKPWASMSAVELVPESRTSSSEEQLPKMKN
jgi:hypothetical protein